MAESTHKPNSIIESDQINKSSTNENYTISPFVEEYFNVHTMKKHPATERFIKQLAVELKDFANEEHKLRISDFYDKHGIPKMTYFPRVDKFEELGAAHRSCLSADRKHGHPGRRRTLLLGKWNGSARIQPVSGRRTQHGSACYHGRL